MYRCACGYTLKKCGKHESRVAHPPKFVYPDRYGKYRRRARGG